MLDWIIDHYQLRKTYYLLGQEDPQYLSVKFARNLLLCSLIFIMISLLISVLFKNVILLGMGILFTFLVVRIRIQKLHEKVSLRNRDILEALPSQISNWCVLMTAGTNIQTILTNYGQVERAKSALELELSKVSHRIKNGYSLSSALREFSTHCNVSEISKLVYYIEIHLKNGENLQNHLLRMNEDLWTNKKYLARKRGEEASSKLLFPMIVLLLTIMGTLLFPVYILMRGEI